MIYISFVYPLAESWNMTTELWTISFYCELTIDVWFVLDVIVQFRTAYHYMGKEQGVSRLEADSGKIADHYLGGWFTIDFISCIPMGRWFLINSGINSAVLRAVRLTRLTRLLRLVRMVEVMAQYEVGCCPRIQIFRPTDTN